MASLTSALEDLVFRREGAVNELHLPRSVSSLCVPNSVNLAHIECQRQMSAPSSVWLLPTLNLPGKI